MQIIRAKTSRPSAPRKLDPAPITLTQFIDSVTAYASKEPRFKCYRGQANQDWANVPGLFRPDLERLEQSEKRAVRDLISVHPNEFAVDETMFDRLVRMQHFGLPTRLMDVSLNPLVALYFASEPTDAKDDGKVTAFAVPEEREKYYDSDAVSCIANLANMTAAEKDDIIALRAARVAKSTRSQEIARANSSDVYKRLHQAIRAEKPHFLPIIDPIDLFKPYYVHAKMSNRRILSQAGGFIVHGLRPRRKISFAHVIEETEIFIPHAVKSDLRQALDLLGINESTLFPEIDKAARRITNTYCN